MTSHANTVALIPVRGGSKSIPQKNIKLINGRPLVYWVLDAACACNGIEKVYIATDCSNIAKVVEMYNNPKVVVVGRSPYTATDTASTESVMLEFAEKYMFDNLVLIQATSPLLESSHLDQGITLFEQPDVDGVMSVVRQKRFLWTENNKFIEPANYTPLQRPRRQDFKGLLIENGAFYITSRNALFKTGCRISGRIRCVEMPEESYFEIDEPNDWVLVEYFLKARKTCDLTERAKAIKVVLTDCDGVLTDGGMYYSETGDELKRFNTKDGMGVQLLREQGIIVGIITGENRELVQRRAQKLKVDEFHMGIKDKLSVLYHIKEKYDVDFSEIVYLGDDINDIDVMKNVGLACCVCDAMQAVKEIAHYTTTAMGGQGALREVAELILNAKMGR